MKLVPILLVVAAAALIVVGRVGKITPVAVAGYVLLALAIAVGLFMRSR